jgi:hypothetical protein
MHILLMVVKVYILILNPGVFSPDVKQNLDLLVFYSH